MRNHTSLLALAQALILPLLWGCGGSERPRPVAVSLTPSVATLGASQTQQFLATVTNTSNTAVTWSVAGGACMASACSGTITSDGLYTAPDLIPDPATVTVTVTSVADPSKFQSASVKLMPISVAVSPEGLSGPVGLAASATQQFEATVTYTSNTAVTWALSGCTVAGCGTISSDGLYTAPPSVPDSASVTVIATSVADPTKSGAVTIHLLPILVSVSPMSWATVVDTGSRSFTAFVQNDPQSAGVMWSLSGAGCADDTCGTLTDMTPTTAVYHAPAGLPDPPTVMLKATSGTDDSKSAVASIAIMASTSNPLLEGDYAFLIEGSESIAGHLEADGVGNLTGIWDANRPGSVTLARPISGSYAVQADGQGFMTIDDGTETRTFNLTVDATGEGARFAEDSSLPAAFHGSLGWMQKQNPSQFALSSIAGDRVIALYGGNVAALGRFTSNAAGNLSNGVADLSWDGGTLSFFNSTTLNGSFGVPDPVTGRGLAVLHAGTETLNLVFYLVSDRTMILVQSDLRDMDTLSGVVRYQHGAGAFANSSLNAPVTFGTSADVEDWSEDAEGPITTAGRLVPDGAGVLSKSYDENYIGRITANATAAGSYAVTPNGRITLTLPEKAVAYLVDQNTGYLVRENMSGAIFGTFHAQTGGPFSVSALQGTFMVSTLGGPTYYQARVVSGLLTLGEDGSAEATLHINEGSGASTYQFSGTFTVASDGRGTMVLDTLPPSAERQIALWAVSPTRGVAILTVNSGDTKSVLLDLRQAGEPADF